jgi:hypothetical protein
LRLGEIAAPGGARPGAAGEEKSGNQNPKDSWHEETLGSWLVHMGEACLNRSSRQGEAPLDESARINRF